MLSDLAKFDLLNLTLAETWPEEKQADMVLKFTAALSGYLGENLNQYFDEKAEEEFEKLAQDSTITPERVIEFYKTKIPHLEEIIDDLVLQFKKIFLLKVYENKVGQLKKEMEDFRKAQGEDKDEIKLQLFEMKAQELADWEQVLLYAQNDDWEKVSQTLEKIPH